MSTTTQVTMEGVAAFIGAASREEVNVIFDLCRTRARVAAKVMASLNADLLVEGDRVQVTSGISPKYLIGEMATVFGPPASGRPGYIAVKLDRTIERGRRRMSHLTPIDFPANCLQKVG